MALYNRTKGGYLELEWNEINAKWNTEWDICYR